MRFAHISELVGDKPFGTTTDENGHFQYTVKDEDANITISYMQNIITKPAKDFTENEVILITADNELDTVDIIPDPIAGDYCNPKDDGIEHASTTGKLEYSRMKDMVCHPDGCESDLYTLTQQSDGTYACVMENQNGKSCLDNITDSNATTAVLKYWDENTNPNGTCVITHCADDFAPNIDGTKCVSTECGCGFKWDNTDRKCVNWNDTDWQCDSMMLPPNATSAKKVCDPETNEVKYCEITECNSFSTQSDDGRQCISTLGDECDVADDMNALPGGTYVRTGNSKTCRPNSCKYPTYKVIQQPDGTYKCQFDETQDRKGTECTAEELAAQDEHAASGIVNDNWDRQTGKLFSNGCTITGCVNGYDYNVDTNTCVLQSKETTDIEELNKKLEEAKKKENSLTSKTLGAVGIGATGIGGMMIGSALSEQSADSEAMADMSAYLATFRCEYGSGQNVSGGTTENELPGGNELFNLYAQYASLASDLKARKESLGMRPGIESEVVLDKSQMGLYDNAATGITAGSYASVARALTDTTGADATAWNEQRNTSSDKLETGLIAAGVGIAVPMTVNASLDSKQSDSKESSKTKNQGSRDSANKNK